MLKGETKEESETESAAVDTSETPDEDKLEETAADPSEAPDEDKLETENADVLKVIHSRFDSHEFPLVQPEESTVEDVSSAKTLVDKVKPDQHKRIQSYVEEKFVEYKDLLPAFDDDDWIVKARWARDTYYVHLKHILPIMNEEKAIMEKTVDDFVPEVPLNDVPVTHRAEAVTALHMLTSERIEKFEALVKHRWSQMLLSFPPHYHTKEFEESKDGQIMKKKWQKKHYYGIMHESVAQSDMGLAESTPHTTKELSSFTFKPALQVEDFAPDVQEKATNLFRLVTQDIAVAIEESVREKEKEVLQYVPSTADESLKHNIYLEWLRVSYLDIVSACIEAGNPAVPFTFVPLVAPDQLTNDSKRNQAQKLLEKVSAKDVPAIDDAVKRKRAKLESSHPEWMPDTMRQQVTEATLRADYYDLLQDVLRKKPGHDASGTDDERPKEKRSAEKKIGYNPLAYYSPSKRQCTASSAADLEYLVAADYHQRDNVFGDDFAFEGYFVYGPEAVKHVELSEPKSRQKKTEPLYTFLVGDESAPLLCKFWGKAALQVLHKVTQWRNKNLHDKMIRVRITFVAVQKEKAKKSKLMTPRRVLVSSDTTTFECVHSFQRKHDECIEPALNENIFLTSFECLRNVAIPFEVSLAGKVYTVGDVRRTKKKETILDFTLQDENGLYIQCMAHGRPAESDVIKADQEIIAYFGSAQPGLDGDSGKIWFFSESHVIHRDEESVFCDASQEIVLK